jgi:hypothetical protein
MVTVILKLFTSFASLYSDLNEEVLKGLCEMFFWKKYLENRPLAKHGRSCKDNCGSESADCITNRLHVVKNQKTSYHILEDRRLQR